MVSMLKPRKLLVAGTIVVIAITALAGCSNSPSTSELAPQSTETAKEPATSKPAPEPKVEADATAMATSESEPLPTIAENAENESVRTSELVSPPHSTFNDFSENSMIIDHQCVDLDQIPAEWINEAKAVLHIAYGHTSHGSQIISGMTGLMEWKGDLYAWDDGGRLNGALDLDDYAFSSDRHDLGHNGDLKWEELTRDYLKDPVNSDVNVVVWSWCGGVSDNTTEGIDVYLNTMHQLEVDYPHIVFVYMTGHADGTGETGNLHILNQRIRDYCLTNNKVLYDFYDIECYDPDGNYFGDKLVNDNCDYDSDGDGSRDANWAKDWQNSHIKGIDWYASESAHSQPLNANMKAYAAWGLWARIAGWENTLTLESEIVSLKSK